MNILETIAARRSVFPEQFTKEPIPKEKIELLLQAANWAPTHRKTEPWRFKVCQGEAIGNLADFLAEKYKETTPPKKFSEFKMKKTKAKPRMAAAVIAICMQRDPRESLPEWEEIAAMAMAVQNLWLAATALGLGGYWSSPATISEMGDFFNLAEGENCYGFFYLGNYEGELFEGTRGNWEEKVEWI
ncbi:MAG: nitroreductase [Leeuwenhoekiella sp.]